MSKNIDLKNVKRSQNVFVEDIKTDIFGKTFVRVSDNSGKLLGQGIFNYIDSEQEKKNRIDISKLNNIRIFRSPNGTKSSPAMYVTPSSIHMISGNGEKGINVYEDQGTVINGPVTFDAHPENIRLWGVYRLNGLLTSTMPSTLLTPISTLILDIPVTGVKDLKKAMTTVKDLFS